VAVCRQAAELATFVDTAAIGLHRVGPDGLILWANDAELETLGYAREEYVGRHIGEFHADQAVLADILDRLHRGERLLEYPAQMRCKDGSLKAVRSTPACCGRRGRFVHAVLHARRHGPMARRQLAPSSAIVEPPTTPSSAELDGVITSWNAGAARIFRLQRRRAVGRHIVIIPPDRLEEERGILRRLRGGEHINHYETVRRAKDGRLLDISLTLSPIRDASGRVTGASKIARDITDRKRAELEREESNRRKDEFIISRTGCIRACRTPLAIQLAVPPSRKHAARST
jgi:PAS domain S-box-containing protein